MQPLLLLTRPEPQAMAFAARAAAMCPAHKVLIAPLSSVVPVAFDPAVLTQAHALILTSVNAVPRVAGLVPAGMTAWCVGPGTAKAAQKAGFTVHDGGGDAAALIETLKVARPEGRLLHVHGVHLVRDLVAALRPEGLDLHSVPVYEAQAVDWPDTVRDLLRHAQGVIAPLFSPRSAEKFMQQVADIRPDGMRIVAISAACAARLPDDLRASVVIAATPDADGMMQAIAAVMSQMHKDRLRQAEAVDSKG